MTALAGLWRQDGRDPAPEVARMLEAQAMYGPEPPLWRSAGPVALGRRLFRLTPADDLDRGPVASADGAWLLAADARIDNRDELADALDSPASARLAAPELLLRLVERFGVAGLDRVHGAWAAMLWEASGQRLWLGRDALGERPLFFHRGDGFVAAASMPKGLHALPEVHYAPDPKTAAGFLALTPETGTESFFAGIGRVPPGSRVALTATGTQVERWWHPSRRLLGLSSPEAYRDGLREQLDRAVARRLATIDGGGVAAHLSAGLDSSAVAATAARQLAPAPLLAFTAVPLPGVALPPHRLADEGPLAAATAALHPNIEHITVAAGATSPLALLDRHFHAHERPVLNPSNAVWVDAISDAARARGVRVLLTGQLGNLGLSYDGLTWLPELARSGRWLALVRAMAELRRRGVSSKSLAAQAFGPFVAEPAWRWLLERTGRALRRTDYAALMPDSPIHDAAAPFDLNARPPADGWALRLEALRRVDLGVYQKGTLGGWGLDLRDPTADRALVEWTLAVPEREFLHGGVSRSLARRTLADRLPAAVVQETRRGMQGADWHVGLTAAVPAIRTELDSFDRSPAARGVIDVARLRGLVDDWPADGWNDPEVSDRYRHLLLRAVAAGHFLRRAERSN